MEFPYTPHPVFPYLASHISVVPLLQLRNSYWCIVINPSPYFIKLSFVFTNEKRMKCSFSFQGFHPGYLMTFSRHVSLGFSRLWQFCKLFLLSMALTAVRGTGQMFCRMFLSLVLSDIFLTFSLGFGVFVGKIPEVKYHSRHIIRRTPLNTINTIYHCWCWPWSPDWGSAVKCLLCCICAIFILGWFATEKWEHVHVGEFFQPCSLHDRVR